MKHNFLISMNLLLILVLSGASMITLAANEIDNLQPGHWYEVPDSQLNQLCPENNSQGHGYYWSSFCAGVINAWSGGAYDTKRDQLMIWGGGHSDYAGNEVYGFNVNTLTWQNITQPSDLSDGCDGFGWNGGCPSGEEMPDGAPIARHTYDSLEYIPGLDKFWAAGGARWSTGALSDATWTLDLANNIWTRETDRPEKSWYYTHFSAYDPVTKNVFSFGQDSLLMHNPVTDQWTELTHGDSPLSDRMTAEIDPVRRIMVVIGDGLAYYYDLSDLQNVTRKKLVTTGDNAIVNGRAPGLVYDSNTKAMIAWSGESANGLQSKDVYELDLDTFQWIKRSPATTNTVIPTASNAQGTYGRFRYIPSKNAFIVVNAVDQNVYFYKLSYSTSEVADSRISDLGPTAPIETINPIESIDSIDPTNLNEIDSLQSGHWYEVPDSQLNQLCPENNSQGHGYYWSSFCAGVINAWSGGAYDTKRDQLMIWGGGHSDYAGNEVYGFNVNTLTWQNITQPSDLSDGCDGFGWNGGCPSGEEMPDGAPIARHTYDSLEYIPGLDKFWAAGGARWSTGALSDATWTLDLANNIWTRETDRPEKSWYYTHFSAYDPVTKNVFSFGQDSLLMHNPVTDQWTELTHGDSPLSDRMTAEIDPVRRIMVVIGDGLAYYYDLSDLQNVTRKKLVTTGDNAIVNGRAPGLVYDSNTKAMIAWSGESANGLQSKDVYELDLDTFQWIKRSPATTNTVIPTASNAQGTYGRFRYIPSKNAFIVVNAVDQNVYFYKLPSSGSITDSGNTDSIDPIDPSDPSDPTESVEPPPATSDTDPVETDPETVFQNATTEGLGELPTLSILEAHPGHITGINHVNELVSVGIPLQPGSGITSVNQLGLQGVSASQFRALKHYPNGEIRWLDLDFLADVSANGTSQVTLIEDSNALSDDNLAQQTASGATVDTGVAQFVIDKNSASLLSSIIVGGVEQLADSMIVYSIKDGLEYTSLADNNTEVNIEENGPVTTIVRVDGRLKKNDGAGHFWYTARLHFVRDSSDVKTELTIRNASQQVLTAQNYDGYGVRFVMANANPKVTFVADDGDSWQDTLVAQETALIYQGYVENHPFNQDALTDCYTWEPTVAGTCSSDFSYNFTADNKGVRVVMAGNTELQGGNNRSVAYAKVESGNQTITLAQRWMANYFPASFEIDGDGQVDIGLHSRYSGKNNQTFNWGGHITREFTIAFASTDSAAVRHKLDWPLVARADFEYYRNAKAMLGDNRMVSFSEEEDYFNKYNSQEPHSIAPVEAPSFTVKRYTHWRRHYTDHLKDVVDFWRGGNPMYMARVLQFAGYETDIAIAHSDGFDLAQNTSLAVPYGEERGIHKYDSEHQLTRYLPIAYYLTGSERVHQAIIDYGEDQLFDERANYFAFPETPYYRAWLRRFENFSWLYAFTEDNRYLEEVKSGIDFLVEAKAVDGELETRGQDKSRGFLNMTVAAGFEERVVHNFFGAQISGDAYFHVMRTLRQTGINYKIEDLEDVILGHAYFLYREMMRNEDGTTSGITYDYYLDQANPSTGFEASVYVADRYLQHIYDMFGIDDVDGVDLFAQAFELNYERGTNVYLPGMMSNGQQQALMYTDLFRPAPKRGYQVVDTTVSQNADNTYTLSWVVPEGAKSYRIKASKNKPIVEWLGYNKSTQQFALAEDTFVPWFAAQNLKNEPLPLAPGTVQSWTVNQLPTDGNWFFSVHYSTQTEEAGIL